MRAGDIVLVKFPFTEIATVKKRPALMLAQAVRSPNYRLITVAMITSQVEGLKLGGDVLLKDWKASGLLYPSLLRLAKIATIDAELIDRPIGKLSSSDLRAARLAFQQFFAPWVR